MFKKIDGSEFWAEKLSGTGAVRYSIWIDDSGEEYIKLEKNVGGGGVGTFNHSLYKLSEITQKSELVGYNEITGRSVSTNDNNMSGFLRAAKIGLAKRRDAALHPK